MKFRKVKLTLLILLFCIIFSKYNAQAEEEKEYAQFGKTYSNTLDESGFSSYSYVFKYKTKIKITITGSDINDSEEDDYNEAIIEIGMTNDSDSNNNTKEYIKDKIINLTKGDYSKTITIEPGRGCIFFIIPDKHDSSEIKYKLKVDKINEYKKIGNSSLVLTDAGFIVDSFGGVDPYIKVFNNAKKNIKYIDFEVSFYNTVGDPAYCEIRNRYKATLNVTGPLKSNKEDEYEWNPIIYNYHTGKMKIKTATITYTDKTKKKITFNKNFKSYD